MFSFISEASLIFVSFLFEMHQSLFYSLFSFRPHLKLYIHPKENKLFHALSNSVLNTLYLK